MTHPLLKDMVLERALKEEDKKFIDYIDKILIPNFDINSNSEEFNIAKKAFVEPHLETIITDIVTDSITRQKFIEACNLVKNV